MKDRIEKFYFFIAIVVIRLLCKNYSRFFFFKRSNYNSNCKNGRKEGSFHEYAPRYRTLRNVMAKVNLAVVNMRYTR